MKTITSKLLLSISAFALISCATKLTNQGRQVRPITTKQKEACRFIDIISESNDLGANSAGDQQNAMNQARNKAAALGGNAVFFISNTTNQGLVLVGSQLIPSSEAVVQAEVYFCKFKSKEELEEV